MAFCTDREDVVSLSLTAVHRLLEKYGVDPADVGRCASNDTLCLRPPERGSSPAF